MCFTKHSKKVLQDRDSPQFTIQIFIEKINSINFLIYTKNFGVL